MNRKAGVTPTSPTESGRISRALLEWLALVGVLLAVAGYVGLELRSSRQAIEASERSRLEHQASIVEKMLGTRLQATSNALGALRADAPALLSHQDGASLLNDRMEVMATSMAGVRTFILVNAEGIGVASNRKALIGGDWHEGERYLAIRAHPDASLLYVSPPFMTPLGNWALSLGRAIVDAQGRFDGYILAIIDPEYFNLLLDSSRYAPDMSTAMIHGEGKIIYRVPDPKGAVGMNVADTPDTVFSRHVRSGSTATSWTSVLRSTGTESLIVFRTIRPPETGSDKFLVASFARETTAVFAPWRREMWNRLALLGVIALAGTIGLYYRQRRQATMARLDAAREAEERRQDEARASLQAKLARSSRLAALGTLVAGVAHEINNPLAAELANQGVALEVVRHVRARLAGDAPIDREAKIQLLGEAVEALEEAQEAGQRVARIVTDMAAVAGPNPKRARTRLIRVVEEAVHRLPPSVSEQASVTIEDQGAPDVLAAVGQIHQVVVNLVTNAAKASPPGKRGGVLVRLGPGSEGMARLDVVDHGIGVDPSIRDQVFDPFFTTRPVGEGRGAGLGLAICSAIAAAHGGTLTMESEVGKGSTFRLELPVAPAEA